MRYVQCGHVQDLSENAAVASLPRARGSAQALASEISRWADAAVSAAVLSAAGPHRARLEITRRMATHNLLFPTLDALLIAVSTCFDRWRTPNSCCGDCAA